MAERIDRRGGFGGSGRGPVAAALAAALIAGATMWLARPRESEVEVRRLRGAEAEALGLYLGWTLSDGRGDGQDPAEGRRYRVRVVSESRDGAEGIARIGGVVTFVPDVGPGEEAIVEVTRRRRTVAETAIVDRLAPAAPAVTAAPETADAVQPGRVFDVVVTEADRRAPERDGVARIGGLVVFVPDARVGERARIRIVERAARWASAVRLEGPPAGEPPPEPAPDGGGR